MVERSGRRPRSEFGGATSTRGALSLGNGTFALQYPLMAGDSGIQQIDSVDRLYETPSNRFVAGFVGDSTALDGRVVALHGTQCEVALADGTSLTVGPNAQLTIDRFVYDPASDTWSSALRCVLSSTTGGAQPAR